MWKFGVNWNSNNLAADFSELFGLVIEGDDFSGADKGEIERIEEEDNIFTFVWADVNVDKIILVPWWCNKMRGRFSNQWHI